MGACCSKPSADGNADPFDAASFGRKEELTRLLGSGLYNVHAIGGQGVGQRFPGQGLLHVAVAAQRIDIVRLLLGAPYKANPNLRDELRRRTPLFVAVEQACATAGCQVQTPAGVQYPDTFGAFLVILGDLVNAGAQVDEVNNEGVTPLILALQHGNLRVAQALLRCGARPDIRDNTARLRTALHYLCDMPPPLLPVELQTLQTATSGALTAAATGVQPSLLEQFLDEILGRLDTIPSNNPTISTKTIVATAADLPEMRTPLHLAVAACNTPAVLRLLVTPGVRVDIRDGSGRTPLHLAVQGVLDAGASSATRGGLGAGATLRAYMDLVELLCTHTPGAVHVFDNSAKTPLEILRDVRSEHAEPLIKYLGNYALMGRSRSGRTLMHLALSSHANYPPLFEYAIDAAIHIQQAAAQQQQQEAAAGTQARGIGSGGGVRGSLGELLTERDANGEDLLQVAMAARCKGAVVRLIELPEAAPCFEQPDAQGRLPAQRLLEWEDKEEQREIMMALIRNKRLDINMRDNWNRTPLHMAVDARAHEAVEMLLTYGMSADSKTHSGRTPLHHAADLLDMSVVKTLLVKGGADVAAVDNHGMTPLHLVARKPKGVDIQEAFFGLLDQGARLDVQDRTGWTPYQHALENGHMELIPRLLDLPEARRPAFNQTDSRGNHVLCVLASWQANDNRTVDYMRKLIDARVLPVDTPAHVFTGLTAVKNGSLDGDGNGPKKTALHCAVLAGNVRLVQYLVKEAGADANAKVALHAIDPMSPAPHQELSPLQLALQVAWQGRREALLEERSGLFAGHDAAWWGLPRRHGRSASGGLGKRVAPVPATVLRDRFAQRKDLVVALLAGGVRVDVYDEMGWTPLHHAAFEDDEALVTELYVAAAAQRVPRALRDSNGLGATPLHVAVAAQRERAAKAVLYRARWAYHNGTPIKATGSHHGSKTTSPTGGVAGTAAAGSATPIRTPGSVAAGTKDGKDTETDEDVDTIIDKDNREEMPCTPSTTLAGPSAHAVDDVGADLVDCGTEDGEEDRLPFQDLLTAGGWAAIHTAVALGNVALVRNLAHEGADLAVLHSETGERPLDIALRTMVLTMPQSEEGRRNVTHQNLTFHQARDIALELVRSCKVSCRYRITNLPQRIAPDERNGGQPTAPSTVSGGGGGGGGDTGPISVALSSAPSMVPTGAVAGNTASAAGKDDDDWVSASGSVRCSTSGTVPLVSVVSAAAAAAAGTPASPFAAPPLQATRSDSLSPPTFRWMVTGGWTPLHVIVSMGDLELAKAAVVQGKADVDAQDELGLTPLHVAVECKLPKLAEYLAIEAKADCTIQDYGLSTPLHRLLSTEDPNAQMFWWVVPENSETMERLVRCMVSSGSGAMSGNAERGDDSSVPIARPAEVNIVNMVNGAAATPLSLAVAWALTFNSVDGDRAMRADASSDGGGSAKDAKEAKKGTSFLGIKIGGGGKAKEQPVLVEDGMLSKRAMAILSHLADPQHQPSTAAAGAAYQRRQLVDANIPVHIDMDAMKRFRDSMREAIEKDRAAYVRAAGQQPCGLGHADALTRSLLSVTSMRGTGAGTMRSGTVVSSSHAGTAAMYSVYRADTSFVSTVRSSARDRASGGGGGGGGGASLALSDASSSVPPSSEQPMPRALRASITMPVTRPRPSMGGDSEAAADAAARALPPCATTSATPFARPSAAANAMCTMTGTMTQSVGDEVVTMTLAGKSTGTSGGGGLSGSVLNSVATGAAELPSPACGAGGGAVAKEAKPVLVYAIDALDLVVIRKLVRVFKADCSLVDSRQGAGEPIICQVLKRLSDVAGARSGLAASANAVGAPPQNPRALKKNSTWFGDKNRQRAPDQEIHVLQSVAIALVDGKCDVNSPNAQGLPPVLLLANMGAAVGLPVLKHIMKVHPGLSLAINAQEQVNLATALHIACYRHDIETARALLEHSNIDPNICDKNGVTPFGVAVTQQAVDLINAMAKARFAAGAAAGDAAAADSLALAPRGGSGSTYSEQLNYRAASLARTDGRLTIAKVDVNAADLSRSAQRPILLATRLLQELTDVNEATISRLLPPPAGASLAAAMDGVVQVALSKQRQQDVTLAAQIVDAILDSGSCIVNVMDQYGRTPLHYAVWAGGVELTKTLLCKGFASASEQDQEGWTVMHVAAILGHTLVLKDILKYSTNSNAIMALSLPDKAGRTPLHYASFGKTPKVALEIAKEMVEAGCNVDAKDAAGKTALHYAAQRGLYGVCEELIKAGASLREPDCDERTPADYIVKPEERSRLQTVAANASLRERRRPYPSLISSSSGHHHSSAVSTPPMLPAVALGMDTLNHVLRRHSKDPRVMGNSGWLEVVGRLIKDGLDVFDVPLMTLCTLRVAGLILDSYMQMRVNQHKTRLIALRVRAMYPVVQELYCKLDQAVKESRLKAEDRSRLRPHLQLMFEGLSECLQLIQRWSDMSDKRFLGKMLEFIQAKQFQDECAEVDGNLSRAYLELSASIGMLSFMRDIALQPPDASTLTDEAKEAHKQDVAELGDKLLDIAGNIDHLVDAAKEHKVAIGEVIDVLKLNGASTNRIEDGLKRIEYKIDRVQKAVDGVRGVVDRIDAQTTPGAGLGTVEGPGGAGAGAAAVNNVLTSEAVAAALQLPADSLWRFERVLGASLPLAQLQDRLRDAADWFELADHNGDGQMEVSELQAYFEDIHVQVTQAEVEEILSKAQVRAAGAAAAVSEQRMNRAQAMWVRVLFAAAQAAFTQRSTSGGLPASAVPDMLDQLGVDFHIDVLRERMPVLQQADTSTNCSTLLAAVVAALATSKQTHLIQLGRNAA